ncbi:N-formylglutamate amidohydrolase [Roseibium aquae]|uniref:N-formylglutamate amidohydrolase n=1 Tax=Roseibium aquae TaxID=1323746 RepID=A0A916X2H0_9HYPH|nr:N-formylglutamate amidohydrolase [Roseibium aquae]GGB53298.1 N-formylglutamate amidohydrolase [Roseibium aquae]
MTAGAVTHGGEPAVLIENPDGQGQIVLVCDHASNRMPRPFETDLGVTEEDKTAHIAWDPGALGVSRALSRLLDAPLIHSTVSRLIIDCNRSEHAPDLIPIRSERTPIPGNEDLSEHQRSERLNLFHRPFHAAIETVLKERADNRIPTAVVSVHSYTPVYNGIARPWEIGLISGPDRRLIDPVLARLQAETALNVGDNEPYSPADGVYYTLHRHAETAGRPALMIEIRNDEVRTAHDEQRWADLLAPMLRTASRTVLAGVDGVLHA